MRRRANTKGLIAAALLPLLAVAAPVAAEPVAEPPVRSSSAPGGEIATPAGSSSSPGGEASTPPAQAPALALGPARQRAPHRRGRPNAEARWRELVQGLKLDAAQQAEVRRALQAQRMAIRRLMSAPPDPGVPRVAAIHAITDRTAERIRAVLNDEQKRLYGEPLPRDVAAGEGKPGVEEWQSALRRKGE